MLTPVLIIVAVLAVASGVVAVAAPNPRHATIGAFAAVLLAALVADPVPSPSALFARAVGAGLGGWLVLTALRGAPRATGRAAPGWAGGAGVAVAAFAIGWLAATAFGSALATGVGNVGGVPGATLADGSPVDRAAIAAAAALGVIAAGPVVLPRDGHRLGLGVVLLLTAASLLCSALGTAADDALQLAFALATALAGAAVGAVTSAMLRSSGDLVLRDALAREPEVRHRAADDAHRAPTR